MTKSPSALHRAFDEARFGFARTLDLRSSMPTGAEAVRRAEPWLRERQMAKAGEVLVITGRGNGSPDGIGVVREAMQRLFATLRRKGVVASVAEHSPGSFVVTLAGVRALFAAAPRSRAPLARVAADPRELAALDAEVRSALRRLAELSLDALGAPRTDAFVADEMRRQFAIIASAIAPGETDREARLQFLVTTALREFEHFE